VDEYASENFDYVITVCDNAREQCPVFPATVKQLHRDFPDPAGARGTRKEVLDQFRRTRDLIRDYSKDFVDKYIKP
jgi:arsenate reductase